MLTSHPALGVEPASLAIPTSTQHPTSAIPQEEFRVITTGISVNTDRRTYERVTSARVRGSENGKEAVNFQHWLIPVSHVLEGLQLQESTLADGKIEFKSSFAVVRIDPAILQNDPEIGLSLSIEQIEQLFKIKGKFDIQENTIVFALPDTQIDRNPQIKKKPVLVEGLAQVDAPPVTVSMTEQRINAVGTTVGDFRSQGSLHSVGSLLGASWYVELDQRAALNPSTWQLSSLQVLKQTPHLDFFLGTQPTFWQSQSSGDFWGVTAIRRQGFAPYATLDGRGGADPMGRLQPSFVTGTLNGYAEPGTLVRLVRGSENGPVVAEQIVGSLGRYQFNQVPVGRDTEAGTFYQLLLYPRGQLTARPRVESARFTLLPEQLPNGASSQILSAGWRRSFSSERFFGKFTEFNAGGLQRWGLSESLTVGLGAIYDTSAFQGLGEIFFQPKSTPLRLGAIGLLGSGSTVRASAIWDDYPNLYAQWTYDGSNHLYSLDRPLSRSFRFLVNGNTQTGTSWGLQFSNGYFNGSTYARLTLQANQRFAWELFQNWDKLNFSHRKGDFGTFNYATYQIDRWNSFVVEYNTAKGLRANQSVDSVLTGYWRYQSSDQQIDGNPLWIAEFGYGVGSRHSGPYASVATSVLPGLFLQARFQSASLFSDVGQFSVSLVSSLGTQSGFYPGNRRVDEMRTQGGLLVQPFFDRNANGKRDKNEDFYADSSDFLIINHELISPSQVEKHRDRFLVRLLPGTYRLDLEAAGFPPDFQPVETTMAIRVNEGSYTPVQIPLQPSYTISGVISRNKQAVNGVRVEAFNTQTKKTQTTFTNAAGVYYLEPLIRGTYRIKVNGQPVQPEEITVSEKSQSLEEINLEIP